MPPELNPQQKQAVAHGEGPLLVIAGAGSGKTRTLTSRLIQLLASGVPPEEIIAITFTNKAAEEMKSRIAATHNQQLTTNNKNGSLRVVSYKLSVVSSPFVGTFHSLGAKILRAEAKEADRTPAFSIFDEDDSLRLLKAVMEEMGISKERESPFKFLSIIGRMKNELLDPKGELKERELEVFERYEAGLKKSNAFDFDDLIQKPVLLWEQHPVILARYRERFRHVLVDEFQDVNTAQYRFVKLLAEKHRNLCVVGDDAQCLPPDAKISAARGQIPISRVRRNDRVLAAGGRGATLLTKVSEKKRFFYRGPLIRITTVKGKTIRVTPNHMLFGRLRLVKNIFYVYLMYRADRGFRIGIAKGARWSRNGEGQIGLIVRNNQEKADKVWVIKVCSNRRTAEYYEFWYAFSYGIPTVVFDTGNRNMLLAQQQVDQLYRNIDTRKRARKLMQDEWLFPAYPHWIPKGTIRHSSRRLRVRVTLFDDWRRSDLHPWGMSRLSVNTKDLALKKELEKLGLKTRKGKLADWRLEIARLRYEEIEKIAKKLSVSLKSKVEFVRSACLTNRKRYFFQPASHLRPTMAIPIKDGHAITEDVVKTVAIEQYRGAVYDLNIGDVHNYIADGVVVHNSIYGFRGSDFRNFLNFEGDWPEAKVVKLEQNYRSTKTIIAAASGVISGNRFQKPKELWTENEEGTPIAVVKAGGEDEEAEWIVNQLTNRQLTTYNKGSVGILYRTNAQSRALEQALIAAQIPYRLFGGVKFYERLEIKDAVAGLRLAQNPADRVSRERIEKTFNKKIGDRLLAELPGAAKKLSLLELISWFLKAADYRSHLTRKFKNAEERWENIQELILLAGECRDLGEFLERVSLFQSSDRPAKNTENINRSIYQHAQNQHSQGQLPSVNLMTIHLAKGLEFDRVFVAGVNEGTLPHHRSYRVADELEEERRLMYVAMTRAKKELFLSFSHIPSRFLYEIPGHLTEFIDLSGKGGGELPDEEEAYID